MVEFNSFMNCSFNLSFNEFIEPDEFFENSQDKSIEKKKAKNPFVNWREIDDIKQRRREKNRQAAAKSRIQKNIEIQNLKNLLFLANEKIKQFEKEIAELKTKNYYKNNLFT